MTPCDFHIWLADPQRTPLVMGILNLTPDSFSDGGRFSHLHAALKQAEKLISDGADLLDVGGESTRPGSEPVSAMEQVARIGPFLHAVRDWPIAISVDTTRASVAAAGLSGGAAWINDVSGGEDDLAMLPLVAKHAVPYCLMHRHPAPAPHGMTHVIAYFEKRLTNCAVAGISRQNVVLDCGIGFHKNTADNLALLAEHSRLKSLGCPLLLGVSRKRFIGEVLHLPEAGDRDIATAAISGYGVANGADILRVHDVKATAQTIKMLRAISGNRS